MSTEVKITIKIVAVKQSRLGHVKDTRLTIGAESKQIGEITKGREEICLVVGHCTIGCPARGATV